MWGLQKAVGESDRDRGELYHEHSSFIRNTLAFWNMRVTAIRGPRASSARKRVEWWEGEDV